VESLHTVSPALRPSALSTVQAIYCKYHSAPAFTVLWSLQTQAYPALTAGKTCLRQMEWVWRGEHYAATRSEYYALKNQLAAESFPAALPGGAARAWEELDAAERAKLLKERLKKYTQKVGCVGGRCGWGWCWFQCRWCGCHGCRRRYCQVAQLAEGQAGIIRCEVQLVRRLPSVQGQAGPVSTPLIPLLRARLPSRHPGVQACAGQACD
jgi:hypothetical protein